MRILYNFTGVKSEREKGVKVKRYKGIKEERLRRVELLGQGKDQAVDKITCAGKKRFRLFVD